MMAYSGQCRTMRCRNSEFGFIVDHSSLKVASSAPEYRGADDAHAALLQRFEILHHCIIALVAARIKRAHDRFFGDAQEVCQTQLLHTLHICIPVLVDRFIADDELGGPLVDV